MTKTSPRDIFLHLLAFLTLYSIATATITLFFQIINYLHPDPLTPYIATDAVRWAIAALIIVVPVHAGVALFLNRGFVQNPESREGRLRKWLIYFTLFVAAALIIGDLVALIYNFLNGEFTTRFLLKVLSILLVAGSVFWYLLWDLKRMSAVLTSRARITGWAVIVIILLLIVSGFYVTGSPFKQRAVRLDQQRVNDLQIIQSQILTYWQNKNALPASLTDLTDSISGFKAPQDPQTNKAYLYNPTGSLTFELCADFSEKDVGMQYYRDPFGDNWAHDQGHQCFARTIDPQLYKQNAPKPAPIY